MLDKYFKAVDTDAALDIFLNILLPVMNKHAPVKKWTVRTYQAPWVDQKLKTYMHQRNDAKRLARRTKSVEDKQKYCKLRNFVTKLNLKKKKQYYVQQLERTKSIQKQLWKTLNSMMSRKIPTQPTFIDYGGTGITKPRDVANHLNIFSVIKCQI